MVEKLEVFWPTTGQTQAFNQIAVDQFIQITEGQSQLYSILVESK